MDNKKKRDAEYPTLNEFKSKKFLNIATAVGIGVSAAAISIELDAEEEKTNESEKAENPEKKMKDNIILLVAKLGNDDFKERDKATKELISLGKKFKKEKKSKMTVFLKAELTKCHKSKNPEVKMRAKKILLALAPAPPSRSGDNPPRMMGLPPPPRR